VVLLLKGFVGDGDEPFRRGRRRDPLLKPVQAFFQQNPGPGYLEGARARGKRSFWGGGLGIRFCERSRVPYPRIVPYFAWYDRPGVEIMASGALKVLMKKLSLEGDALLEKAEEIQRKTERKLPGRSFKGVSPRGSVRWYADRGRVEKATQSRTIALLPPLTRSSILVVMTE
jgi:hypothetical protein